MTREMKEQRGLFGFMGPVPEFWSLVKYIDQWAFLGLTRNIITQVLERPIILKKAKGKFVPWSEAQKWYFSDLNIYTLWKCYYRKDYPFLRRHPGIILVERFEEEDGYSCYGDSGRPVVVKSNGNFVLVATVSKGPGFVNSFFSFPPTCHCNCNNLPETHARTSAKVPWILKTLADKNLDLPCQRNLKNWQYK